jgi:ribosomal protein L37AE/L43A
MTKVTAVICPNCKDKIYSRARHDFRSCTCGDTFVDGGFDYLRTGFKTVPPERIELEVGATKNELYDDWNRGTNKFGIIKA